MEFQKRTVTCGELRPKDAGRNVTLNGWVNARRDYGGVIFIDMRDRNGITQCVIDSSATPLLAPCIKDVRNEWVLWVNGVVRMRENPNPNIPTGLIEIIADDIGIINSSEVTPFEIVDDLGTNEELRLEYRYLDLRRRVLQKNFEVRNLLYQITHQFFAEEGFTEVETPVLTKSTPEGARDYLVPSRVNKGRFYALPQSPQLFKQLLMVSGFDKYMQIVKCFRDEDLRADRQPEFTQIDVEMSFVDQYDIIALTERFIARVWHEVLDVKLTMPLRRISYEDAMNMYGTDKPDLRLSGVIVDITRSSITSDFSVFKNAVESHGVVKALVARRCSTFSRRQIDELTERARTYGAKGLPWLKYSNGEITGSFVKAVDHVELQSIIKNVNAADGDLIVFAAGEWERSCIILGALRKEISIQTGEFERLSDSFALCWITEFPLLEYSDEEKRWVARHHPFTSPMAADISVLKTDPSKAKAVAYDLVINGYEAAGGSIRIHRNDVQKEIFSLLGMSEEEAQAKFGFLLEALRYGAPPHGGIAFGFDRLVMALVGTDNIRDVVAFPKTTSGLSLVDGCPTPVSTSQLEALGIQLKYTS